MIKRQLNYTITLNTWERNKTGCESLNAYKNVQRNDRVSYVLFTTSIESIEH